MNEKTTLTNDQRQTLHKRKITIEVSLLEEELLVQLRKLSHGRFIIQMLDGVPFRYQIEISKFFEGLEDFDILRKEEVKGGEIK